MNFQIKYLEHNYNLICNTLEENLKIKNFIIKEIAKKIKKENEMEEEKIIKENKNIVKQLELEFKSQNEI